jgi:Co/Zn/Cd efflux system component
MIASGDPVQDLATIPERPRGLIRDTGAILIDMNPDRRLGGNVQSLIESKSDRLADLHLWRLGPGHLGAIIFVIARQPREADYYRALLARFQSISHLTIEVEHRAS